MFVSFFCPRQGKRRWRKKAERCRNCGRRLKGIRYRGEVIVSRYCGDCFCRKVEGGVACEAPRVEPTVPYCALHLLCTATHEDGQCNLFVRSRDPEKFKFCAEKHACTTTNCKAQRALPAAHCLDHLCEAPGCTRPKVDNGNNTNPTSTSTRHRPRFCALHSCADAHCAARCDDHDTSDDSISYRHPHRQHHPQRERTCAAHRRCARPQCHRRAHVRESGEPTRFCGAHYCRWEGCGEERVLVVGDHGHGHGEYHDHDEYGGNRGNGGTMIGHCRAHTCRIAGCGRALAATPGGDGGGMFCAGHECRRAGCRLVRFRGSAFCHVHCCARRGCEREVAAEEDGDGGGFCRRHQPCAAVGCDADRLAGGPYCAAHKCGVDDCWEMRRRAGAFAHHGHGHGYGHGQSHLLDPGARASMQLHPFCSTHSCRSLSSHGCGSCTNPIVDGGVLCAAHKCTVPGCWNEAHEMHHDSRGGGMTCHVHCNRGTGVWSAGGIPISTVAFSNNTLGVRSLHDGYWRL